MEARLAMKEEMEPCLSDAYSIVRTVCPQCGTFYNPNRLTAVEKERGTSGQREAAFLLYHESEQ